MDAETQSILNAIKTKFEKTACEIAASKLKKVCPFYNIFGDKIVCPYKEDGWHTCFDIAVAPGNGDAWCIMMIERGIIDTELHYDDNHDDGEWEGDNNV